MAVPSEKNPVIDRFLTEALGLDRRGSIQDTVCVFRCGRDVVMGEMTEIEQREFRISGICKACQDEVFKELEA